ncbi:twin-arginine translocase TatA/TatE family subunit [uncultured Propionibacterium sp.]|uniref:twin-arginine translocase TatA/TatE family subunit n=1 Tax=uncultured Propionibacterium sp. TaxID=218066 RepID=UPI002930D274|nr:twin-arginine translocase TatA/TatE family subunit [uncultured Propionibacterium sp.]
MNLGWQELLIVLGIAVLLFGGTKLAGLGRASGKAIREFKEETEGLSSGRKAEQAAAVTQAPVQRAEQAVEGVDPTTDNA